MRVLTRIHADLFNLFHGTLRSVFYLIITELSRRHQMRPVFSGQVNAA